MKMMTLKREYYYNCLVGHVKTSKTQGTVDLELILTFFCVVIQALVNHNFSGLEPLSSSLIHTPPILMFLPPPSLSHDGQYVHNLMPRGQYTSGKGSSAVGLTAYVTRDPDTRQLVLQT